MSPKNRLSPERVEALYASRPFQTRNADEYDVSHILNLFVNPIDGLADPFGYENAIVKGRMGSGKTMFLRANHAFHFYGILPALTEGSDLILPVFVRLNDFQHLTSPEEIYRELILKLIKEISSAYVRLQDVGELARIHFGIRRLATTSNPMRLANTLKRLSLLGASEYVEKVEEQLSTMGGFTAQFFKASLNYNEKKLTEVKSKSQPGISDVQECYEALLAPAGGKILLLLDEAASLNKSFFRPSDDNESAFEVLMNQLRTAHYIRTKVAIYPNSFQDVVTETRYGDVVALEENVMDEVGYESFRRRTLGLIEKYLNPEGEMKEEDSPNVRASDIFDISPDLYGDCVEQIIYASGGNLRRLIQMLDLTLDRGFASHRGTQKIQKSNVFDAMKRQSQGGEGYYDAIDREFLQKVQQACRNRSTYRFQFPAMSAGLNKYTARSREYNLVGIVQPGAGRRGTIYAFDYCYCVAHDLPTHFHKDAERINKNRSLQDGRWIGKAAKISEEVLGHSATQRNEGTITYWSETQSVGMISGADEKTYFFGQNFLLETYRATRPKKGIGVRFTALEFEGTSIATEIELLA